MYLPKSFQESNHERLRQLIADYPFAVLVSHVDDRLFASHVPFLYFDGALWCHLASANPQAESLSQGGEVLCIFQGPHAYISPSWYEKADVPTWNYMAVHVHGEAKPVGTPRELAELVDRLSSWFEAGFPQPWKPEYPSRLLAAISGFRIQVNEMHGKFKLSQNRSETDRARVIQALAATEDPLSQAMATAMRRGSGNGE